jgi:hypothetical protein
MKPSLFRIDSFINPRMCHIKTYTFPKGTWNCEGMMYPAVGIKYLFWYVFCMYAVYGITYILLG